jgi:hypothetical protein
MGRLGGVVAHGQVGNSPGDSFLYINDDQHSSFIGLDRRGREKRLDSDLQLEFRYRHVRPSR